MDILKRPLVSIIIPTFNRPDLLRRAISSALGQTYPNIEVIVVDDHSDNDLESMRKEFPAVRFYRNSENKGGCFSRNRGIKEAAGKYVNFLDDDDELYPEKVELQVRKFAESKDPKLGMITCHSVDFRSGRKKIVKNRVQGDIYRKILSKYIVAGTEPMLFKASVFDEIGWFDERLQSSQEYDLYIRASEKFHIEYVDEVLTQRNRSRDQISLNFDKKIQGAKRLIQKHDTRYREIGRSFHLRMRLKLYGLIFRFLIGKYFGEKAYRFTIFE